MISPHPSGRHVCRSTVPQAQRQPSRTAFPAPPSKLCSCPCVTTSPRRPIASFRGALYGSHMQTVPANSQCNHSPFPSPPISCSIFFCARSICPGGQPLVAAAEQQAQRLPSISTPLTRGACCSQSRSSTIVDHRIGGPRTVMMRDQ